MADHALLLTALVYHTRGRSLDSSSPVLLIHMERLPETDCSSRPVRRIWSKLRSSIWSFNNPRTGSRPNLATIVCYGMAKVGSVAGRGLRNIYGQSLASGSSYETYCQSCDFDDARRGSGQIANYSLLKLCQQRAHRAAPAPASCNDARAAVITLHGHVLQVPSMVKTHWNGFCTCRVGSHMSRTRTERILS